MMTYRYIDCEFNTNPDEETTFIKRFNLVTDIFSD